MRQLEIEYFFPLTEQMVLDLDYKPCNEFEEEKRKKWLAQSTLSLAGDGITTWSATNVTPTFQFKPAEDAVGYWEVSKGVQVWRAQRPNWLHQKMTKVFFGWEWKDK